MADTLGDSTSQAHWLVPQILAFFLKQKVARVLARISENSYVGSLVSQGLTVTSKDNKYKSTVL